MCRLCRHFDSIYGNDTLPKCCGIQLKPKVLKLRNNPGSNIIVSKFYKSLAKNFLIAYFLDVCNKVPKENKIGSGTENLLLDL